MSVAILPRGGRAPALVQHPSGLGSGGSIPSISTAGGDGRALAGPDPNPCSTPAVSCSGHGIAVMSPFFHPLPLPL